MQKCAKQSRINAKEKTQQLRQLNNNLKKELQRLSMELEDISFYIPMNR